MSLRFVCVVVVALVAVLFARPAGSASATSRCYIGHSHGGWDVHRVYPIPHGCIWLVHPNTGYFSIGPEFRIRFHGLDDAPALPRDPMGDAAAVCGFSRFFVSWPYFLVTAHRVAWGDGTGCHDLEDSAQVIWAGHFEWRPRAPSRDAHWEPILDISSPPLRR